MASTSGKFNYPGDPDGQIRGAAVHATMRRVLYASEASVTTPDYRTHPLSRGGMSRFTLYVEGTPGDQFAIEMCYRPLFIGDVFDPVTSKWVTIGSAVIPALPYKPVVKQTFEDLGFFFRVVRVGGPGNFEVMVWGLD